MTKKVASPGLQYQQKYFFNKNNWFSINHCLSMCAIIILPSTDQKGPHGSGSKGEGNRDPDGD